MIVRATVKIVETKEVEVPDECVGLLQDYDEYLEEQCLIAICNELKVEEEDVCFVTDTKLNPMIEND